jgi:hypothetical protein
MYHVTAPGPQHQAATLEWEVVDLLLSDERVVQEMFEDIVTAEWPPTPEAPTGNSAGARGSTAGAEKAETPAGSAGLTRPGRTRRPGTDGWSRERSPPKHQQHAQPSCMDPMEVMPHT